MTVERENEVARRCLQDGRSLVWHATISPYGNLLTVTHWSNGAVLNALEASVVRGDGLLAIKIGFSQRAAGTAH